MKKIEALIQTTALDAAQAAVRAEGFLGMTAYEVHDFGRRTKAAYRGVVYDRECQPTIKIEIIVPDADVRRVAAMLLPFACPGREGVGELFVSPVSEVIRMHAERPQPRSRTGSEPQVREIPIRSLRALDGAQRRV